MGLLPHAAFTLPTKGAQFESEFASWREERNDEEAENRPQTRVIENA
jgi:hypothetical protein